MVLELRAEVCAQLLLPSERGGTARARCEVLHDRLALDRAELVVEER
jgi:hypothetical protein